MGKLPVAEIALNASFSRSRLRDRFVLPTGTPEEYPPSALRVSSGKRRDGPCGMRKK